MKWIPGVVLVLVGLGAAEEETASKLSPAREAFSALQEKYDEAKRNVKGGLRTDNREALRHIKEYIEKYLAHVKKYPNDPTAVEALLEAIDLLRTGVDLELHKRTVARLREDYLRTPLVITSLKNMGLSNGKSRRDLLREIGRTNESKRIRALAWREIINGRQKYLDGFTRPRTTPGGEKVIPRIPDWLQADVKQWKEEIAEAQAALRSPDLAGVLPDLSIGSKAPATSAVDLSGKKVLLADHKSKVILLDFWHTRCGPCIAMIPSTRKLVQEMRGRPFIAIGISVDFKKKDLLEFAKKTELPGEQWWAGWNSRPVETWNVRAYPTIYVIDHRGMIRHHQLGHDAKADPIPKLVRELVRKAEAASPRPRP